MNLLENQRLAEKIDQSYIDLESAIMKNIVRHLKDYKQPIASDDWLLKKLAEIGKLNKENMKLISRMAGVSNTAAERMLNEAAEEALKEIEPAFEKVVKRGLVEKAVDPSKSRNMKRAIKALFSQAKDVNNRTNTVMLYKAKEAYTKLCRNVAVKAKEISNKQSFLDMIGKRATELTVGATSRQQAMRDCIREFNEKGIPAFIDKAGREWTPEAYVNMVMRNTARQTSEEVQSARCKDYGINLIAIDSHSGARPKCAKDQGKIFDLNNGSGETEDLNGRKIKYYPWSSSSYGEPDGILGINCGHHKHPFIPGVNIQRYFPTEDYDANNKLYKQTQVQRALEREVRKQKRECMLLKEIGDEDGFKEASVKLKAKEAALKQYVGSHANLTRRKNREEVVGFDKSVSTKTVSADRKVKKEIAGRKRNINNKEYKTGVTNGENLVGIWRRRPEFLEEIDDIINAQGFDGLPKLAKRKEFENFVIEDHFLGKRAYRATSAAQLKQYSEELRSGKWYIDCRVGGSQYGKGMYVAADYTKGGNIVGLNDEMKHYSSLGAMNFSKVETLTMDKSANILKVEVSGRNATRLDVIAKIATEYVNANTEKLGIPKKYIINRSSFDKETLKKYDNIYFKEWNNVCNKMFHKERDPGAVAAELGYDAINAMGHGSSGSYTVILNRTKLIILEE